MPRLLLSILLTLSSCGADVADHPANVPEASREAPEPSPDPIADPAVVSAPDAALAWSWSGPAPGPEILALPPAETVDPGGLTCRFGFDEGSGVSTLACIERRGGARRWGFDVRDGTTAATLLREGEMLVSARFDRTGFGAVIERFDLDTGERRWRRELAGLVIPIRGLAVQHVELAHVGDRIAVRGWDAGGRWVAALDEATGAIAGCEVHEGAGTPASSEPATTEPPSSASSPLTWQWDGPPLLERARLETPPEVAVTGPNGRCRWVPERNDDPSDDDRSHLECLDRRDRRVWGFDEAGPWPDMEGRALAILDDTLFVLSFHRAASGASMTAYDLATGRQRWTSGLYGIGPIAHSGYMAWAELRILDGRPVVYGWEASGRYIEVLDPATGATVASQPLPV